MKRIFLLFLCLTVTRSFGQNNPGFSFYDDKEKKELDVCPASKAFSESDVTNLVTQLLSGYGIRNRYIIKSCSQVDNCQAVIFENKPYILYNPEFLNPVKKLNFTTGVLPDNEKDWAILTILAHELGHHVNNHLTNPFPGATDWEMELEADETAGFIIYLIGGSLKQTELAYANMSEEGSYTHPGRQRRLEAVRKGWQLAQSKYPSKPVIKEDPGLTVADAHARGDELYNKKDYTAAIEFYMNAAGRGYALSQYSLGRMYYEGVGVKKDYVEAMKWLRKAADQGHANALGTLGNMYDLGRGVARDSMEAIKFYKAAAESGSVYSQINLGQRYQNSKNYAEALKWYTKAANQNNAMGQYYLGRMYSQGLAVKQDFKEAQKWHLKSAEQGYVPAQVEVGWYFKYITKKYAESLIWYRKAAEKGNSQAQHHVADQFEKGLGTKIQYDSAAYWYRKSADGTDSYSTFSLYQLGQLYEKGRGGAKNLDEAISLYRKAAKKNLNLAKERLKQLGVKE